MMGTIQRLGTEVLSGEKAKMRVNVGRLVAFLQLCDLLFSKVD